MEKVNVLEILAALKQGVADNDEFILPIESKEEGDKIRLAGTKDGKKWMVAFTEEQHLQKGNETNAIKMLIADSLRLAMSDDTIDGLVINPWSEPFFMKKEWIELIIE